LNSNATAIIGEQNIIDDSTNSNIIGEGNNITSINNTNIIGSNITATTANTTYVNNLNINDTPSSSTTITDVLVRDTDGTVKTRELDSVRYDAFQTLSSGATVTWDMSNGINASVTLGGNSTLAISGAVNGMVGVIKIVQDATGSRTLALPANSLVINGGAGAITLTTTASAVDVLSFIYDGTDFLWTYGVNYN
jgi:hypothetical protein